ncbi:outer membrane beta-barrel protein [Coxiella-like endosymbiont]|uniref:outer membrane beta-barrel protein n=1 Tax=Coxiella-like endosymbiont TaxID=1592897 RepID=UPI00272AFE9E|nr:outer membrane beta-barrel protein [Coxiella-like endosymbiont]
MSVKKIITFATAGIASVGVASAAVAGGPDYVPAPSYAGVYVEGNVGYVYRPWKSDVTTLPGTLNNLGVLSSSSRGNGGFTFGGDLGYQFNQYFAVEGGWFYLPKAKFTINPTTFTIKATTFTIKGGLPYAALKAMVPIYENTYVFGKLGLAYSYNRSSSALVSSDLTNFVSDRSSYWNPLFAVGVQYYFTPNWSVNAQYTFVPGYRSAFSTRFVAPVAHLFTVGIGYKFLM